MPGVWWRWINGNVTREGINEVQGAANASGGAAAEKPNFLVFFPLNSSATPMASEA